MSFNPDQIAQLLEALQRSNEAAANGAAPPPRAVATAANMKIKLHQVAGDNPIDWHDWSKTHLAQARAVECADTLTTAEGQGINVGAEDFDASTHDAGRVRKAQKAWISLITTCEGMALDVVQSTDSPNEVWRKLQLHYRATRLKEKSRLTREFSSMKMEVGESPKKFVLRVDSVARELERPGKTVDEDDRNLAILSGLSSEYEIQRRILEGGDADELTRAHLETVFINQYDRIQETRAEAGAKALMITSKRATEMCQWCKKPGHTATDYRNLQRVKGQPRKFSGNCNNCGKKGHRAVECRGTKKNNDKKPEGASGGECFTCGSTEYKAARCPQRWTGPTGGGRGAGDAAANIARITAPEDLVVSQPMSAMACNRSDNTGVSGKREIWSPDSGASETMTPNQQGFEDYKVAPAGTEVEIADGNFLPVAGTGKLQPASKQPDGIREDITSNRVLHVPGLGRNLLLERRAAQATGRKFVRDPTVAHLGQDDDAFLFFNYSPSSGLYEMQVTRKISTEAEKALKAKAPPTRDIMEMHNLLAHPSENITRDSAEKAGIALTGEWTPCVPCDKAKARRHAVSKTTDNRAMKRGGRLLIDLTGPMRVPSVGGNVHAMIIVDDFSRYETLKFL